MAEAHAHSHGPQVLDAAQVNRAFLFGIALNLAYVGLEFGYGLITGSLALLADAGHNLSDVGSLVISLLAFWLARRKATESFTYGYRKSTVLASLLNSVLLLLAVGVIGYEAVSRFRHPEPVAGGSIAWIAGIGILVNSVSAFLFFRNRQHDLNVKSAYLHLAADALVSVGVVVTGLLIKYTSWYWLDPAISLVVMVVIVAGTWSLLKESLRLSLDAVPAGIDMEQVRKTLLAGAGVVKVDHVHVWALGTTENALTAHLWLAPDLSAEAVQLVKATLRHELLHLGISHATFETEQAAGVMNAPDSAVER